MPHRAYPADCQGAPPEREGLFEPAAGRLLTFARGELLQKIAAAEERVWLASPFLTAPIAARIRDAVGEPPVREPRLLTALTPRSVQVGILSPAALSILQECGFEIATIPNIHAKVSLVDSSWGLVGSGNLTGTGLGGAEGGNVELGALLDPEQLERALELFADWWEEADPVSAEEIAAYDKLPRFSTSPTAPSISGIPLGLTGTGDLEAILAEDESSAASRRYWIKSNYHRPAEEHWWHRDWISDWRLAPYEVDDLIVLYLSARDGGPARCPAVVRVTSPSRLDPDWVVRHRDVEAAERWPYVTETSVVGEVPVLLGAELSVVSKNGQSVQGGYCSIARGEFEALVEAMLL
jgi:phosphatidylserine/phosphatidylglycerophosphate/cardiolipin synthase-like enzyme